jgi:glutathione synthase
MILGVVMDPIGSIKVKKDSSYAMLLAAQARGWPIVYFEQRDLFVRDGRACGHARPLTLFHDEKHWFDLGEARSVPLDSCDVILMRKDPPFDIEYVATTYLLELAAARGTLVVNDPRALRDINEKMFITWFPQCTPPTLVTRRFDDLNAFLAEHEDVIVKPLDGMGGAGVFRVRADDPNRNVIFETLTQQERRYIMAQRYLPEIAQGDKRILLVDGEPVRYALARIPKEGETRGNLAAGGRGEGVPLTERDRWICAQVGPELVRRGVLFAGLDVIGDYLTEINVTSPTCIRELDALYGIDIGADLIDAIGRKLAIIQQQREHISTIR